MSERNKEVELWRRANLRIMLDNNIVPDRIVRPAFISAEDRLKIQTFSRKRQLKNNLVVCCILGILFIVSNLISIPIIDELSLSLCIFYFTVFLSRTNLSDRLCNIIHLLIVVSTVVLTFFLDWGIAFVLSSVYFNISLISHIQGGRIFRLNSEGKFG